MTNESTDTCASKPATDSLLGTFPVEKTLCFALVMTGFTVMALGIVDDATAQIRQLRSDHGCGKRNHDLPGRVLWGIDYGVGRSRGDHVGGFWPIQGLSKPPGSRGRILHPSLIDRDLL